MDDRVLGCAIRATRRRLRVQGALDGAAIALGPAFPLALAAWQLERFDLFAVVIGAVVGVALVLALRPRSDVDVAARRDRAGRLADRVRTAVSLARVRADDPIADALIRAAVRDGIEASRRASAKEAVPYRMPGGMLVAIGLVGATTAIAIVVRRAGWATLDTLPHPVADDRPVERIHDDLDRYDPFDIGFVYWRAAEASEYHPEIGPEVCALDTSLDRLASGTIDKQQLLDDLAAAEQRLARTGHTGLLDDVHEAIARLHMRPRHRELAHTAPTADVALASPSPHGPSSRRETIAAAARAGFSSVAYKKVYADYRRVVEDTLHAERVPAGYRDVVARYFFAIRPASSCFDR